MAREEVRIPIKVEGADKARRDIEGIGKSSDKTAKGGVRRLGTALKAVASAAVVAGYAKLELANERLDRRLRAVSSSAAEMEENFRLIQDVSRRTRSDIETNAATFQRLKIATDDLGLTSKQTAQILTTLNQAFAVGGASASEVAAATTQLGQALASGKLNGDELRSLTENASLLADILGDEIGGRGIASLRELSREGKLTSDVLASALLKVGGDIDERFSGLPATFSEALTELKNSGVEFVKSLEGPTGVVVEAIQRIAQTARIAAAEIDVLTAKRNLDDAKPGSFATPKNRNRGDVPEAVDPLTRRLTGEVFPSLDRFLEESVKGLKDAFAARSEAIASGVDREIALANNRVESAKAVLEKARRLRDAELGNRSEAQKAFDDAVNRRDTLLRGISSGQDLPVPGSSVDEDPAVVALKASVEKREEINEEFLNRLNEQNQAQFEKDLARYELMEEALTGVFSVAGEALKEYVRTGEFDFKQFGSAILETLADILLQALITQAVTSLIGGAPTSPSAITPQSISGLQAVGSAFAGGFASGGTIPAGQFGLVGEQGPEFISGPATITPIDSAAGGSTTVKVYIGAREIAPEIIDVMKSESGQRAQLENMTKKKTQTKRLLA